MDVTRCTMNHTWSASVTQAEITDACRDPRCIAAMAMKSILMAWLFLELIGPKGTVEFMSYLMIFSIGFFCFGVLLFFKGPNASTRTALRASIRVDESGILHARWGVFGHKWKPRRWHYRIRGGKVQAVVNWPWCIFPNFCIFPTPIEKGHESNRSRVSR